MVGTSFHADADYFLFLRARLSLHGCLVTRVMHALEASNQGRPAVVGVV